ncbi:hypothetical protein UPYG_G00039710 [Umbra pygmaea]|uniref:Major facilitator superfamily (MFS) profile domain-containing protein n=1 Tax=Umbra pygmaea TaxID=75934 RepID=A0ABD0XPS1_UMBPY
MEYKRKKKLTFFTIGLIFFLSGIEYAVILPTIWRYLQTLGAQAYFLGLTMSAFSFSGLLSGPLFGHWSDKTRTTKKIILFANMFEILGNIMYFIGYSKWLLVSSRLVAGIGTGAGSSIFGYLSRSTAPKDRSTVFAVVMASRQAGLLIGPGFNVFLRLCDFRLGPFVVNKYTAPGLFMCVMWILLQLAVCFLYWDIPPQEEPLVGCGGGGEQDDEEQDDEEKPLIGPHADLLGSYGSVVTPDPPKTGASYMVNSSQPQLFLPSRPPPEEQGVTSPFRCLNICREYLREEVVVLLTAQFVTLFNQTALETMVTPMTQQYFNFAELENSIMYCICGVEVIAGFLFVRWLSYRMAERVVLAVGLVLCNISCVWCLVFLVNPQGTLHWQLAEFIIGVFLQLVGLPFVAVAQISLFSKITCEKTQGLNQGIRRSVGGLATILGPIWAGGLLGYLYVMLGVMMVLLILLTIMVFISYKRLVAPAVVERAECSEGSG